MLICVHHSKYALVVHSYLDQHYEYTASQQPSHLSQCIRGAVLADPTPVHQVAHSGASLMMFNLLQHIRESPLPPAGAELTDIVRFFPRCCFFILFLFYFIDLYDSCVLCSCRAARSLPRRELPHPPPPPPPHQSRPSRPHRASTSSAQCMTTTRKQTRPMEAIARSRCCSRFGSHLRALP